MSPFGAAIMIEGMTPTFTVTADTKAVIGIKTKRGIIYEIFTHF
jgi:hypothetical protein